MVAMHSYNLDDVCEQITDGKHGDCINEVDSGFYFLSAKDIVNGRIVYENARQITETDFLETHKRTRFEAFDILFTNSGTIGRMAIAPNVELTYRSTFQKSVAILKPRKSLVDPRFLYYLLLAENSRLADFASGTAQKNLLLKDLRNFRVSIPDRRTQCRIAEILSPYDDLIESNRRRIKILEEMAQALYREWFVLFRFPGHGTVELVDSSLGRIPQSWEWKKTTEAVSVNPRTSAPKETYKPHVPMDSLATDSMLIGKVGMRKGNNGSKFKNADTLFARITPCLENGKTAFVQFLSSDSDVAIGSTEFIVLRSKTVCPEYVYLMARSNEFRDNAIKSMSGATGRQRVQEECFEKFLIAQPDGETLRSFQEITKPMFQLIHNLAMRNANLRRTRDLLLPGLLSGEIAV